MLGSRQRLEHGLGVSCELAERPVLLRQDLEYLVGVGERGVGAVDDVVQVRSACREPGPELVEDQRELLAHRLLVDVLDDVEVDGRVRACDRQVVAPVAGAARDPRERCAR